MLSLDQSFKQLERIVPGIKSRPGYFKHHPKSALKLADWVERYQALTQQFEEEVGQFTFSNFDTETTGLNSPEDFKALKAGITDIAVSRMVQGEYLGGHIDALGNQSPGDAESEYESLSNPGVPIPKEVTHLTGITNAMAKKARDQVVVLEEFKNYTDQTIFVGHNIGDSLHNKKGYDIHHVIGPLYERYFGVDTQDLLDRAIDTLPLFRFLVTGMSHTNDEFCQLLGVSLKGAHRAMPDVRANALAFSKLVPFLNQLDPNALRTYATIQLEEEDSSYITTVRSGGLLNQSWCEVVIRLKDQFKTTNGRTRRQYINYATVRILQDAVQFTDTTLKNGEVLSAQVIEEHHPASFVIKEALIRARLFHVDELLEVYQQPIYF